MIVPGRVSLITAVYNKEKYLAQSIEASLAMKYHDLEIIIVNDGSTDNSRNIIQRYAKDSRIRIIDQGNAGSATALNNGIQASTGEFYIREDADDWSEPSYIEETMPRMAETDVAAVCTHVMLEGDAHRVTRCESFGDPRYGATIRELMVQNWYPNALTRRSVYDSTPGFNPAAGVYADWNLWIDITKRGWKVAIVDRVLHHYRITYISDKKGSETAQIVGRHEENFAKIRKLHPDLWPGKESCITFCPDCNQIIYLGAENVPAKHVCEKRRCGECGEIRESVNMAQRCQAICGRRNRAAEEARRSQ
jgi:glycosyltransferase involved in cell wall biosynthesis